MVHNLGSADRSARVVAAVALFAAAVAAPVPVLAQLALALTGVYMVGTSLVGTCLGYKLIGVSTCPIKQQRLRP
jgi:hypothetical protein